MFARWAQAAIYAIGSVSLCATLLLASQGNLWNPTTGTVSGLTLVNNYNAALSALASCNSGNSSPSNDISGGPVKGQCWLDTSVTPNLVRMWDGTSVWVVQGALDATNGVWVPPLGGGPVSNISSAATTDLGSVRSSYVTVSGTVTITSFGNSATLGTMHAVRFTGSLTLTHNATSLVLPNGGVNIQTQAGDIAMAFHEGSGNWRVVQYQRGDGTALANPAVPVGSLIDSVALSPPTNYDWAAGQALSRTTYSLLMAAITSTQSVTRSSGSPTLTGFSDTTQFAAGMPVEGTGIPGGATILSCSGSSCTLSANASSSGTANVTVFPSGNGNGSTTFNLPNINGRSRVARDNMNGTDANVLQVQTTISTTSGVNTATVGSGTSISVGMTIVSANVPAGTTVASVSGTSISMSQNASATAGGTPVRFSPIADARGLLRVGGAMSRTYSVNEMPTHNHGIVDPGHVHPFAFPVVVQNTGSSGQGSNAANSISQTNSATTGITINNAGGGAYANTYDPAIAINVFIRVLP